MNNEYQPSTKKENPLTAPLRFFGRQRWEVKAVIIGAALGLILLS